MFRFVLILLLLFTSLYADDLTVSADDADYRGKKLALHGHVHFSLSDGSQLKCTSAEMNFKEHEGVFFGDSHELASYQHVPAPFLIRSMRMKGVIDEEDNRKVISELLAEQDVSIRYQQNTTAYADKALYKRDENAIVLLPESENGNCAITTLTGDHVKANEMKIDTLKMNVGLMMPTGVIKFNSEKSKIKMVEFSAGVMAWDHDQELVTLKDNADLLIDHSMKLKNDRQVTVKHRYINGENHLQRIEAAGKTILTFDEPDDGLHHTLTCYGGICVDHPNGKMVLSSPIDAQGNVAKGDQVFFKDHLGTIYANRVSIDYELVEHHLEPKLLILEGHVIMQNQFSSADGENGSLLQYALADRVEFNPKTQDVVLKGKSKRVLFFDKINNVQVSAPALTIKRDPKTGKDYVKGAGDVRFTFLERELEQLREHFNLEQ